MDIRIHIRNHAFFQEIGDLLSNTLTLDDEDAVQNELLALQQDIVSLYILHLCGKYVLIRFPGEGGRGYYPSFSTRGTAITRRYCHCNQSLSVV
jgi:hypothetical protein